MKIEGRVRAQIWKALESGLDAARLQELYRAGATPADVRAVVDELADDEARSRAEKLLAVETPRTLEVSTGGARAHDIRAQKKKPWWSGLDTPAPIHEEPARDVEIHGERFTKDDVASMLRNIGR